MTITYSNIAVTSVFLKRGNTIQNDRYLGLTGEVTVDTQAYTLRIHDGIGTGGHVIQSTPDLSNVATSIIPSANVTYSLGSPTRQWKDLFVSNNTIYMGGTPLTINSSGQLTVGGNLVTGGGTSYSNVNVAAYTQTMGYTNYSNVNTTSLITSLGLANYSNVNTAAYTQTMGFTNFSNVNVAAYLTSQGVTGGSYSNVNATSLITSLSLTNYSNVNTAAYTQTMGYTNYSNVNLTAYLGGAVTIGGNLTINGNLFINGNSTTINANNLIINDNIIYLANANPANSLDIGFVGHFTATRYQHTGLVRQATSGQWQLFSNVVAEPGATIDFTNAIYDDIRVGNITSPTITGINANVAAANVGIIGYIDQANTIQSAQVGAANLAITAANVGLKGYIDLANTIQSGQVGAANLAITTANTAMKGYVDSQTFYSNARVATYLQYGNIANISAAGNITASYFIGNGALLTGIAASSNYSNVNVATYLPTYAGNIANIRLGVAGVLTFADGTTQTTAATGGSSYSNVNVAAYLGANYYITSNTANLSTYAWASNVTTANTGVVGYVDLANTIQSNQLTAANTAWAANAALQQSLIGNLQASAYSNVNLASYLAGNVTVGTISLTGNVNANNLVGSAANTTITAGTFVSTFNNAGNVILPNVYVSGNVTANYFLGNGALLTGIVASGSTYGNTQVAQYLQVGNIANVSVAGNVTATYFLGNGSQLTGISSSYSNVQTAAYLNTQGYNLYSNVNVAAYLGANPQPGTYSNTNVASYLPTYSGNISANITHGSRYWTFGTDGKLTLSDRTTYISNGTLHNDGAVEMSSPAQVALHFNSGNVQANTALASEVWIYGTEDGAGIDIYNNAGVKSWSFTPTGKLTFAGTLTNGATFDGNDFTAAPNSFVEFAGYTGNTYVGLDNDSVFIQTNWNTAGKQWTFANTGNLIFPDNTVQTTAYTGTGSYSNVQVASYLGSLNPVKLGSGAGTTSQGTDAVAVGRDAGQQQGTESVAIGVIAGKTNQGSWGVAIGSSAGTTNQGQRAIAIGVQSAEVSQGAGAVAIGAYAGDSIQGQYAIAIGTHAGDANQPASSIILNASGSALNGTNAGLYINPVRNDVANVANVVYYNAVTNELTYAPAGSSNYSNVDVANYLPTYAGTVSASLVNTSGNILSTGLSVFGNTRIGLAGAVSGQFHTIVGNITQTSSGGAVYINTTGNVLAAAVVAGAVTSTGTVAVNAATGITTNQGTFLLANATATTINMGGAATTINMGSTASATGNVFVGGQIGSNAYNLTLRANGTYNIATSINSNGGFNSPPYANQAVIGGSGTGMTANYSATGGYLTTLTVYNVGTGYRNGDVISVPGGIAGNSFVLQNYNSGKTSTAIGTALYTFGIDGNLTLPGNIIFADGTTQTSAYGNAQVATYLQVGNIANVSVAGNVTATLFKGNGALLTGIMPVTTNTSASYNIVMATPSNTSLVTGTGNGGTAATLNPYTGYIGVSGMSIGGYGVAAATGFDYNVVLNGRTLAFTQTGNLIVPGNVYANSATIIGNVTAGNVGLGVAGILTFADSTTQTSAYSNVNLIANLRVSSVTVGNLTVLGALNTTLDIGNSFVSLATNNIGNTNDIGFYGQYNAGQGNVYTGLAYTATDGMYRLFSNLTPEPGTTINQANVRYSNIQVGGLNANGNILAIGASIFGNATLGLAGINGGQFHTVVGNITQTSSGGAVYFNTTGNVVAGNIISSSATVNGIANVNMLNASGNLSVAGNTALYGNTTHGTVGAATGAFHTFVGNINQVTSGGTVYINTTGNLMVGGNTAMAGNTTHGTVGVASGAFHTFVGNITQVTSGGAVGINTTGNISASVVNFNAGNVGGFAIGYRDMPQITAANLTLIAGDAGKHYYATNTSPTTLTIPLNSSVAFALGTVITVVNQGTGNITIARNTTTMYLAGNSTSADRTITSYGVGTLLKVATDTWFINGNGVV